MVQIIHRRDENSLSVSAPSSRVSKMIAHLPDNRSVFRLNTIARQPAMAQFEGPHYLTGDLFRDADQAQLDAFQRDRELLDAELDRIDQDLGLSFATGYTLCSMRAALGKSKLSIFNTLRQMVNAFYSAWRDAMISIEHSVSKYSGNCYYSGRSPSEMFLEEKERYRIMRAWFGEDC